MCKCVAASSCVLGQQGSCVLAREYHSSFNVSHLSEQKVANKQSNCILQDVNVKTHKSFSSNYKTNLTIVHSKWEGRLFPIGNQQVEGEFLFVLIFQCP